MKEFNKILSLTVLFTVGILVFSLASESVSARSLSDYDKQIDSEEFTPEEISDERLKKMLPPSEHKNLAKHKKNFEEGQKNFHKLIIATKKKLAAKRRAIRKEKGGNIRAMNEGGEAIDEEIIEEENPIAFMKAMMESMKEMNPTEFAKVQKLMEREQARIKVEYENILKQEGKK